jgi:hypothetical protein
MKLGQPQNFYLELVADSSYRLSDVGGPCKFSAPASARGAAKLYTVAAAGILIYVGVAAQPMSSRLNFGFKATGKGGYHGYKWKGLRDRLSLAVWTATLDEKPAAFQDLETVEAEVVFLCREQSGQWPAYQHEIHFHGSDARHRACAASIYSHAIS